jgi:hypothetical protein
MERYRLCIARPTGWNLEAADMGTWLFHFGFTLPRVSPELTEVLSFNITNHRVAMCRNNCVSFALRHECTHILWLDPDMALDRYVKWNPEGMPAEGTKAWWHEAWPFIKAHPGSIVAVPYCGGAPGHPIHIFVKTPKGSLTRLSRELAQQQRGFASVEAVGAGSMLMDTSIFKRLKEPYFKDTFTSPREDDLRHSSDVEFSLRCRAAGIPIYVSFDTWAGHWQSQCVERPGFQQPGEARFEEPMSPDPSIPVLRDGPA